MIKSTKDILRRAVVETTMASVIGRLDVESSRSICEKADALAEDVDFDPVDMVILPGGKIGIENLGKSKIVEKKSIEFAADKHVQPTAQLHPSWLAGDCLQATGQRSDAGARLW